MRRAVHEPCAFDGAAHGLPHEEHADLPFPAHNVQQHPAPGHIINRGPTEMKFISSAAERDTEDQQ